MSKLHHLSPISASAEIRQLHPSGAFASRGRAAHQQGLSILPTSADDAKRPVTRNWQKIGSRQYASTIEKWAKQFSTANYGILPGPSGLVVVDADTPAAKHRCLEMFGQAAIVVRTGRECGGWHLYYAAGGQTVPSGQLRPEIDAEIKSWRTFVVGPGSIHPDTGRPYEFEIGSFDDLSKLGVFQAAALSGLRSARSEQPLRGPGDALIPEGTRNDSLFAYLRECSAMEAFGSEQDAIDCALDYNATHHEKPEDEQKAIATARKVWGYQCCGTVKAPRKRWSHIGDAEHHALRSLGKGYSDALALFVEILSTHAGKRRGGESFAIAATPMAQKQVIPGWTDRKRYQKATKNLLAAGLIALVTESYSHRSRIGEGNFAHFAHRAAQYRFGRLQ